MSEEAVQRFEVVSKREQFFQHCPPPEGITSFHRWPALSATKPPELFSSQPSRKAPAGRRDGARRGQQGRV